MQALNEATDLVMLAIGGNDTGFSEVFSACRFESPERCAEVAARVSPRVDALTGSLVRLYQEVLRRAPNALVIVVLYADSLPSAGTPGLDACESLRAPGDELSDADLLVIEEWGKRSVPAWRRRSPRWPIRACRWPTLPTRSQGTASVRTSRGSGGEMAPFHFTRTRLVTPHLRCVSRSCSTSWPLRGDPRGAVAPRATSRAASAALHYPSAWAGSSAVEQVTLNH